MAKKWDKGRLINGYVWVLIFVFYIVRVSLQAVKSFTGQFVNLIKFLTHQIRVIVLLKIEQHLNVKIFIPVLCNKEVN